MKRKVKKKIKKQSPVPAVKKIENEQQSSGDVPYKDRESYDLRELIKEN